jgi:hypothetical protein
MIGCVLYGLGSVTTALASSEETDQREHHRDVAGPVGSEQPADEGDVVGEAVSGTMTRPRAARAAKSDGAKQPNGKVAVRRR